MPQFQLITPFFQEFRTMQDQLAETKEKYRMASGGVQERTRTLAEVIVQFICSN